MSEPQEVPHPAAPTRTRFRRARMMAALTVAAAVFGVWASSQSWWSLKVEDLTPVTSDLQQLAPVSASAVVSAKEVATAQSAQSVPAFGPTPTAPAPQPGTLFGLTRAAGLLAAAAVFVVAGVLVRVSLVPVLGVVCSLFAWSANQQMLVMVENPEFGGAFVTRLGGAQTFMAATALCIGLATVTTAQVWIANAPARAEARERARASGLPAGGLLAAVSSMVMAQMGRFDRPEDTRTPERG